MRLNQDFSTRSQKWRRFPEEAAVDVDAVVVAAEVVVALKTPAQLRTLAVNVGSPEPSIRICLLESGQGARYISNTGKMHIFVQNHLLARGRMSTPLNLPNETGTSSRKLTTDC